MQKGVLYSGSKIYNRLPLSIKAHSNNAKCFKATLKRYLIEHVFYSLDEYYQFQWLWFFYLFIYFIYLIYFIYFIYLLYFVYLYSLLQLYFNNYKILCNMKLDLLILLYFYAFMLWLIYVWVVLQIVLWQMFCTLCVLLCITVTASISVKIGRKVK